MGTVFEKRIHSIRQKLENETVEKATVSEMVDNIEVITVYPGYLEIRFYIDKRIRFPLPEDFVYRDKKMLERKRILHYMEENSCITAKEIALMEQVSLSTVNYRIKRLKQEGRIYFDGRGGKGKWVVVTKE